MAQVRIAYRFADGHVEEVEVALEVAEALKELDRQEYNNTQKETRRHTSLDAVEYEDERLADPHADTALIAIRRMDATKLWAAFIQLKPKQRELLYALYLSNKPISQAEYAARHGLREESVKQSAWRARLNLKKFLEKL